MLLTILNILLFVMKFIVCPLVVIAALAVGVDLAWYYRNGSKDYKNQVKAREIMHKVELEIEDERKAKHRRQKEESATYWWIFQGSYVPGFQKTGEQYRPRHCSTTSELRNYYKIMDELGDTQAFEINFEEN